MRTTVRPHTPSSPEPPPTAPRPASRPRSGRRTEVALALLFLLATASFAVGDALLERAPVVAVVLQTVTGLAVVGTGWLLLPVLLPHAPRRAWGYLLARGLECAAIMTSGLWLLVAGSVLPSYPLPVYLLTAVAGLLLTHALLGSRLVPRWLAGLGLVGYAALLLGALLDVVGVVDLTSTGGFALLAPGGLFEVLLPALLLVRGFRR